MTIKSNFAISKGILNGISNAWHQENTSCLTPLLKITRIAVGILLLSIGWIGDLMKLLANKLFPPVTPLSPPLVDPELAGSDSGFTEDSELEWLPRLERQDVATPIPSSPHFEPL